MTDYQDLVRRLRSVYSNDALKDCEDAADAIEALLKELEKLREDYSGLLEDWNSYR